MTTKVERPSGLTRDRDHLTRIRRLEALVCAEGGDGSLTFPDAMAALAATRDLRGYWRLGEGSSPYADTSGHVGGPMDMARVAHGTAMTQDYNPGALPVAEDDGAVAFNAATYNTQGDNLLAADTRFDGVGTLCAWVKPTLFSANALLILGTWAPFNGGYAIVVSGLTGQIGFFWGDTASTASLFGPSIPLNQWTFVAVTKVSSTVKLYVNGSLVAATTVAQGMTARSSLRIGGNGSGGSNYNSLNGGVDEASHWGDVLTADEVAILAAAGGLALSETGTVVAASGAYTAAADEIVLATGTVTITLPTAVGISGRAVTVKNVGTNTVTVARTSSQTIDGAASNLSMATTKMSRTFISDGAGWQIVRSYL